MNRKCFAALAALGLLVASLVSAVGCSQGGEGLAPGTAITVDNVTEMVGNALEDLNSYEMALEMTISMEGVVDGEEGKSTMSAKGDGALDMAGKKMGINMAMSVNAEIEGESIDETTKLASYVIGDTLYVGTTDADGNTTWQRQSAPASTWERQDQIEQQMKLLRASKVKYVKSEKVQTTDCYVIELEPDLAVLWEMTMQQFGSMDTGMDPSDLQAALKKVTAKYWFDKDNLFFRKAYVYMQMEMGAAQLGATSGQIEFVAEMTMDFTKHNQTPDIQLPAGAR